MSSTNSPKDNRPPAKTECCMNICDITGKCAWPENCDERGYITHSRNFTSEERRARQDQSLRDIGAHPEED